ncbi:MAG: DUF501 domain-containing protein [Acidimicrobiia bacterium]
MDDESVVAIQIGRPPRSAVTVRARCHLRLPVAIEVPPVLDDGTPFPTLYWLTCPLAVTRISRIESHGGVRAASELLASDPDMAETMAATHRRYAAERDSRLPADWDGPVPSGGVAGSIGGVKCLHAQYADTVAGNQNPIGEQVAVEIEPLDCLVGCVVDGGDGVAIPNPEWSEPV